MDTADHFLTIQLCGVCFCCKNENNIVIQMHLFHVVSHTTSLHLHEIVPKALFLK
jgi:hypothetical protein